MPTQISGIQIADNGDGTCDVQVGGNGYGGLRVSSLFDFGTFQQDQLLGNIRLTRLVGNYGAVGSQELADRLNAQGVHLGDSDYAGFALTDNGDGTVTVAFSNQTITVDASSLGGDTNDQQMILYNVVSFLRLAGYADLTTPSQTIPFRNKTAIQAVAEHTFWY